MHVLAALQYLGDLGCEHIVLKNDEMTVDEIAALQPRGILVSPGPGDRHYSPAMQATCARLPGV